ncbi:hypothetical protein Ancab_002069 [Ancistrocladus abbreviatus]
MFSIAAINDTNSHGKWEPLAPTKEAQEFHITQTYHDGLLRLQAKDYDKARELLENVLKDPLLSSAQADSTTGDGHLLQLRFLSLKNLATVFLQQGSAHHESALRCYLQAVEIDTKDFVVWNQLGTLSCLMGLLSISRWAFEQGLICSPNNWNCMEKLLEVLIAIGDEVACLSVADLILRHWPSHSRALHVKCTIEDSEPIPFAPRGIDKLEPKHPRLRFGEKRKAMSENAKEDIVSKRLNRNIEVFLEEFSWTALADAILRILNPPGGCSCQQGDGRCNRSADTRVVIRLPTDKVNSMKSAEPKGFTITAIGESITTSDFNAPNAGVNNRRELHISEEQTHERRSSRRESLRSHKPGKEESEIPGCKNVAKVVTRFLEPFVMCGQPLKDFDHPVDSVPTDNSVDHECSGVADFVEETSKNFGAYHLGYLLLEKVARSGFFYRDALVKFLELEKLTRHWARNRSPECCLFLAELYNDLASSSSDVSMLSELMSETTYHLCKIIESVAMEYPFDSSGMFEGKSPTMHSSLETSKTPSDFPVWQKSPLDGSILSDKTSFWVRFFWVSGHVSVWEDKREKAQEEFCIALSLLENNKDLNDVPGAIRLPYCKVFKDLTTDRILHEINLLELHLLMKKTVGEMIEKEMYSECIDLLAPHLFSTKINHLDVLPAADKCEAVASVELSALDVLIKSCEKVSPLNMEVYLNCHQHKLQILMMAAGMGDFVASSQLNEKLVPKLILTSDAEPKDSANKHLFDLLAGEVKAISHCASLLKNWIDQSRDSNGITVPTSRIGHIQSLLLALMCNIGRMMFFKKTPGMVSLDQTEQKQKCCFVDAAIAFCKLQHLDLRVPIKIQVDLIVAIHDLLAEFGLCCVGEDGEGVDGTFLKLAIKHLLVLDMRLKSNLQSSDGRPETTISHSQISDINAVRASSDLLNMEMDQSTVIPNESAGNVAPIGISSDGNKNEDAIACGSSDTLPDATLNGRLKPSGQCAEYDIELTEDEREELELAIDNALDQCLFCLYGLNLRSDSSYEDDLAVHKNTSRADYQSKEQCADVFKYILPYAKASTRTGLVKLRRVLRAIRKHFPQPPEEVLAGNPIDKFLDDPNLCEEKLWQDGSDGFLQAMVKIVFPDMDVLGQNKILVGSCEPYLEVYSNLYYLLAQSEETSATDKWPGFVLTKEGEEFVEQNANLFKYDLLFNPLRFESWQRLANIYDEEVDLLLNDGSKHINVAGWRKNAALPQRVEASRRRSRRCLLMSLALAKTLDQQGEIHELLALVYYDGLQNVVPFYDQRTVAPSRDAVWMMFCQNSMKHFDKAFAQKPDWSHAFYLGKLCEKLGYSPGLSFSYYHKAIVLNPSAVDPVYRMHASRIKQLSACQRQDVEALKVFAAYSFNESTKETVMNMLDKLSVENQLPLDRTDCSGQESHQLDNAWDMLYNDCLSALEICVEGELKHFHKARYMLAQGLYRRGKSGDLEKAKEELSFCFKSSRSSFTINMWEIDGMVKKGRRKTPGVAGNKKILEVNLPESSRKFITCIRKYLLFYLKLLEETGDICTLDRALLSIRADKRFSLCLEDLAPVALGRYLNALVLSKQSDEDIAPSSASRSSPEQILEKMFTLFMEQGSLWAEVCSLPDIKSSELTESTLYGHLHQHIYSLERSVKLETLEGINEKIRKRFKNPKLSNSNCARVCKHASIAWCRSLIINLVLITPLQCTVFEGIQVPNLSDGDLENNQLLCVDIQTREFWNPSLGNPTHLMDLEAKWNPVLSRMKNAIIKKASEDNMETANSLLRSAYSFYRDSSSVVLSSGVSLYFVPARLATNVQFQPAVDGVEVIDVSIPRKLLIWAYTLLHGRCTSISAVIKYCEENAKLKMKKGAGNSSTPSTTCTPTASAVPATHSVSGGCKDGLSHGGASEAGAAQTTAIAACNVAPTSAESQKILSAAPQLHQCNNIAAERINIDLNADADTGNLDKS